MNTPTAAELGNLLEQAHSTHATNASGAPASYIPELAAVDPALFGLASCAVDGGRASCGDAQERFTLQSISKPFVYAWALDRLGEAAVHARVGVEPSGNAFDSMVRLESESHLPHNPMVNAGAIAVTGLLLETGVELTELQAFLGECAGRGPLDVDVPVWLSERTAAHRNRAIAHLMSHFGALRAPVDATLDLYFRQCAALVNCEELAVMAATLAGFGRSPIDGRQVLSHGAVERALTVMSTCGLYDATGRFTFEVGLAAKSGVCGGILAVAPGQLGLAAFSPPLDTEGNSVRARAALVELSTELELHAFDPEGSVARNRAPLPEQAQVEQALHDAHAAAPDRGEGTLADYAPALANAPRADLALAACTVSGVELSVGASERKFTVQAVGNAFLYAHVHAAVGVTELEGLAGLEPSGNPFHALLFHPRTGLPYNPLGNAGAIAVASRAPGADEAGRLRGLLNLLSTAARESLHVDAAMLEAETRAAGRNRAIASLLRGRGVVPDEEVALRLYLQQCCITVDVTQLARLAGLLAAGGVVPGSGERLLSRRTVRDTLSLMYTCGLHDGSGRFAFEVGLPAKSGISGALIAIAPGRMGLAAWSPAVDGQGTSVRGFAALRSVSRGLRLGTFE